MGNGQAIARRLAGEGARVVVTDLLAERAAATVASLPGGAGLAVAADAGDIADCQGLVPRVEAEVGPVDKVVCNVGITGTQPGRVQDVDDWQLVNDVNV